MYVACLFGSLVLCVMIFVFIVSNNIISLIITLLQHDTVGRLYQV